MAAAILDPRSECTVLFLINGPLSLRPAMFSFFFFCVSISFQRENRGEKVTRMVSGKKSKDQKRNIKFVVLEIISMLVLQPCKDVGYLHVPSLISHGRVTDEEEEEGNVIHTSLGASHCVLPLDNSTNTLHFFLLVVMLCFQYKDCFMFLFCVHLLIHLERLQNFIIFLCILLAVIF